MDTTTLLLVPIEQVQPAKDNPRRNVGNVDELANSIRAVGLLEPLVVTNGGDRYQLVAGARRLAGAKKAGLVEVPVIVRELSDEQRQEAMLIENLQREDLLPLEEAEAFQRLLELDGYTQRKLAERIGRSQSHISKRLALLELPAKVVKKLDSGGITLEDAQELAKLKENPARLEKALSESRWYGIQSAVRTQLRELEQGKNIAAKVAQAKASGAPYLDWPKNGYYDPPKGSVVVSTEEWSGGVTMAPSKHAKLDCHAVSVNSQAEIVYLCTNAAAHAKTDPNAKRAVERNDRIGKKKAHDAELRAAAKIRIAFARGFITGKVPRADATEILIGGFIRAAGQGKQRHACILLGVDPPRTKSSHGGQDRIEYEKALRDHAAKGETQRIQVGLALTCAVGEEIVGASYMSWDGETTRAYFELLEKQGYKPAAAEKRELSGKAPS